jgi:hypothetical protein
LFLEASQFMKSNQVASPSRRGFLGIMLGPLAAPCFARTALSKNRCFESQAAGTTDPPPRMQRGELAPPAGPGILVRPVSARKQFVFKDCTFEATTDAAMFRYGI